MGTLAWRHHDGAQHGDGAAAALCCRLVFDDSPASPPNDMPRKPERLVVIEPINLPLIVAMLVCGVLLILGIDGQVKYVFGGAVLGSSGLAALKRFLPKNE